MLRKPIMAALVAAGVVTGAVGGWSVDSFATNSAPTGIGVCIDANAQDGPQAILNPVSGKCPSGYALTSVADNSDLVSLFKLTPTQFTVPSGSNTDATYSYTVPPGVHDLEVEMWGGGGGGGGDAGQGSGYFLVGGGGGAQGSFVHTVIPVTGGSSCTVTVGAGGAGGSVATSPTNGQPGDTSEVDCPGKVSAPGGDFGRSGGLFAGAAGGVDPAGLQDAAIQTFNGQSGSTGGVDCTEPRAPGGGTGFPGAGGSGGWCDNGGANGSPGLVIITPKG